MGVLTRIRSVLWRRSISVVVAIVFCQFLFFVRFDVLFPHGLADASLDPPYVLRFDLVALDVFVKNKQEFDFLGQLVQLEFAIMTQVRGREERVQHDPKGQRGSATESRALT